MEFRDSFIAHHWIISMDCLNRGCGAFARVSDIRRFGAKKILNVCQETPGRADGREREREREGERGPWMAPFYIKRVTALRASVN